MNTITTKLFIDLPVGEIILISGRLHKIVKRMDGMTYELKPLRWYERLIYRTQSAFSGLFNRLWNAYYSWLDEKTE